MPDEAPTTELIPAVESTRHMTRALRSELEQKSLRSLESHLNGIDAIGGENWFAKEFHENLRSAKDDGKQADVTRLLKLYQDMIDRAGSAGQRQNSDLTEEELQDKLKRLAAQAAKENPALFGDLSRQLKLQPTEGR